MFDNLPVAPDRGPYPLHGLGPIDVADLIAFALSLDERALSARFHRHMTPEMVSAHYRALDWDRTVAIAWIADGQIRGVQGRGAARAIRPASARGGISAVTNSNRHGDET
jgi:hypothetical protein